MPLKKYRIISPYTEAIQYTGDNYDEIKEIFGDLVGEKEMRGFNFDEFDGISNYCEPSDYIVKDETTGDSAIYEEDQFERDFIERDTNE